MSWEKKEITRSVIVPACVIKAVDFSGDSNSYVFFEEMEKILQRMGVRMTSKFPKKSAPLGENAEGFPPDIIKNTPNEARINPSPLIHVTFSPKSAAEIPTMMMGDPKHRTRAGIAGPTKPIAMY